MYDIDAREMGMPATLQGRGMLGFKSPIRQGILETLFQPQAQAQPTATSEALAPAPIEPSMPQPQPQPQGGMYPKQGGSWLTRAPQVSPGLRAVAMAAAGSPSQFGANISRYQQQYADEQREAALGNRTAQILREAGYEQEAALAEAGDSNGAVQMARLKGFGSKPDNGTAAMQNFQFRSGLSPEQREVWDRLNGEDGQEINVYNQGSDKFAEEAAKNISTFFGDKTDQGVKAQGIAQSAAILERLNNGGGLPEGFAGTIAKNYPQIAMNDDAQLFEAVISQNIGNYRVEGSGSQSDKEFQGILNAMPQLRGTKQGRTKVIEFMKRKSELDLKIQKIALYGNLGMIPRDEAVQQILKLQEQSLLPEEIRGIVKPASTGKIFNNESSDDGWTVEKVGD